MCRSRPVTAVRAAMARRAFDGTGGDRRATGPSRVDTAVAP
jgi:hypothetical protein